VKKQTFKAWAVTSESGHLAFTSATGRPLLFSVEREAKRHLQMMEDAVLVRVIVEPIKPKRARGKK
jgi:hypothetical protein